ncbi:protein translocase subunit SecF [Myxococcota bacterium]|nr:protein translocase subunit SecF [Myxococcota bacterium]MBU1429137.1 protein translocase subunit SecF [Myxococcota bacterium]MBU1897013.1 protein translocase subunit SecF [Myxococcota bacterium]
MEFIKPGTRINFLGHLKLPVSLSIILVLGSWALVATKGLNFGIDFAGGTEALLSFKAPIDTGALQQQMKSLGLDHPEIVTYGLEDTGRYFVRSRTQSLLTPEERAIAKKTISGVAKWEMYDDNDEAGEEIRVKFAQSPDEEKLIDALHRAGFPTTTLTRQSEGVNPVFIIHLPGIRDRINLAMGQQYGWDLDDKNAKEQAAYYSWTGKTGQFRSIDRLESVGEAVGHQMRNQGILAVIYALGMILLYISFRFDLRYSPGAVIALFHDVSITIGIYSLLGIKFDLPIIAALLAIVGYSLNDTIVVYDRIRESLQLGLGKNLFDTVNLSINDCLSRTILTSVTTFLAVLAIYIWGGGIIQNFAFAMLVGVIVGTYSSIFIASPSVLAMDSYLATKRNG